MFGAGEDETASLPLFFDTQKASLVRINLFTAFLAGAVVGAFDHVLAKTTFLAAFADCGWTGRKLRGSGSCSDTAFFSLEE